MVVVREAQENERGMGENDERNDMIEIDKAIQRVIIKKGRVNYVAGGKSMWRRKRK